MRMEVNNFSTNRLLLSSYPVTFSVLLTSCCCFFRSLIYRSGSSVAQGSLAQDGSLSYLESHGSVSSFAQGSLARDRRLSDLEYHGSVSSVAQGSFARDGPLSDLEYHGSVSSVAQGSFAGDGPLSDPESHGSISSAVRGSLARHGPLSDRSLMGQSHQLYNAHLLEAGLSLGQSHLLRKVICWRQLVLWSGVSDANCPLL